MKGRPLALFVWCWWVVGIAGPIAAEETKASETPSEGSEMRSVESIAEATRPSLVTITHRSRTGGGEREGSGFAVGPDLVATNYHVIGDARPIQVITSEGRELTVEAVHASDRKLDLAILRVREKDLVPLTLGNSEELPDGHPVVAMGNPQGFRFSVVEGIISAVREVDGLTMIQLAIPIEPGNSGGPLLDREGKVIGVPTMKSQVSDNIGFAMPVNALKLLLEKPNPIPMERWVTVGQLSPRRWVKVQEGAHWRQRGGTITVRGAGGGFGGRALCLYQTPPAALPYEVAVKVKLDDEGGAAGLAFASDGEDRHYGFYPSGGRLRLTRFDGPDVFSWNILAEIASPAYRPGDWNHLRVIVAEEELTAYVNGEEVLRLREAALRGGRAGLCKFRQTEASFQQFSLGQPQALEAGDLETRQRLEGALQAWLAGDAEPPTDTFDLLLESPSQARALVEERVRRLRRQAGELESWSATLHATEVAREMARMVEGPEETMDLFHAGLLIAKLDQPDLDVEAYRQELEAMADEVRGSLPENATEGEILDRLSDYLFDQLGFHGSRLDYYSRENSYLNAVLDDREGIPITLSVLFMELAKRVGVQDVAGLPLPGHFVVAYLPQGEEGDLRMIDVFAGGEELTEEEAEELVRRTTGLPLHEAHKRPAGKRAILVRMLRNLIGIDLGSGAPVEALPRLDLLLTIAPEEASERLSRALLRYQTDQWQGALEDLNWILQRAPEGIHLDRVRALHERVMAALGGAAP